MRSGKHDTQQIERVPFSPVALWRWASAPGSSTIIDSAFDYVQIDLRIWIKSYSLPLIMNYPYPSIQHGPYAVLLYDWGGGGYH